MSEKVVPASHLNAERLAAFAEASGDTNPIHLDEEVARRSGLPGPIVHGMLSASLMTSYACEKMARERPNSRLASLQIRFKAIVLRDESLVLRSQPKGDAALEITAKNSRGELVVSAVATFREI